MRPLSYGKLPCSLGKIMSISVSWCLKARSVITHFSSLSLLCVWQLPAGLRVSEQGELVVRDFLTFTRDPTGVLCKAARPWEAGEVSAKSSYEASQSTGFYHSCCRLKLHQQHWNLRHFGNGREVWTKQHLLSGSIAQMTSCQMNCCFPVLTEFPPLPSHFITEMPPQLHLPMRALDRGDHRQLWCSGGLISRRLPLWLCRLLALAARQYSALLKVRRPWKIFHSCSEAGMLSVRRRGKPCNRVHQPLEGSSSVFSESLIEGKSCREGKFFSLPLCFFQVTGVNKELARHSGLVKSLDLTPPVPSSVLVPGASQSAANTEGYSKTHRPPAIVGHHRYGLGRICGALGALCSCEHEWKWAQRPQHSLLELCWHPGCVPARGTDCGSAGVQVCRESLRDGISAHGNPEGPQRWWDTAAAPVSITWGDSKWHFRKVFNVSPTARVPLTHTRAHRIRDVLWPDFISALLSREK